MSPEITRRLANWLRLHDGVITSSEARNLGLPEDALRVLLANGRLRRLAVGVFVDAAAAPNPRATIRAGLAIAGPNAVVSHGSAAWLWNLVDRPPNRAQLTIPRRRRVEARDLSIHRSLIPSPVRRHANFPVTDPTRTLIDLAVSTQSEGLDLLIDRALKARLVSVAGLEQATQAVPARRQPGVWALRRRLTARGYLGLPGTSVLESKLARLLTKLQRARNLPPPEIEFACLDGQYRLDYAWPAVGLALEVDGYAWHSTPDQLNRDHERRNRLGRAGWTCLTYTWINIVRMPDAVMAEIADTYDLLSGEARRRR